MDTGPNFIVPTPPALNSTNRIANTEFVITNASNMIASAIAALPVAVGSTQTDFISGGIQVPLNQSYNIIEYSVFTTTFTNFIGKLSTGTMTAILKIGATAITGGTLNLGTAQISATLSALNTAAIGSTLMLTVSSVTSAANFSFVVRFTKALA